MPREKLPRIGEPGGMAGRVTSEAADATGLRAGTPVAYGGGDSHCALLGLGVIGSGQAGLLLGTNSTLRASFAGFVRLEGQAMWAQQHVVPGRYTVSASSMAGSSVLGWLKDICPAATAGDDAAAYRELETLAAAVAPGCDGLLFHPYLYGERSPFSNPYARGAFVGLAHWHGRGHLARAVMEGIAFAVANCLEAVQRVARERDEPVTAIRTGLGGGSRLAAWRQILADALGMALQVVPVEEPGCLGAALLAGVAVGAYADVQSAAARAVPAADRVEPERAAAAVYRDRRAAFNDSYRVLEPVLYRPPGEGDARYG